MSDQAPVIPTENPALTPAASRLEQVRARREKLLSNFHVDAEVPTWDGALVARYRPLLQSERDAIRDAKIDTLTGSNLAVITQACIGLYFDGEPIVDEHGTPARYGRAACEFLGVDVPAGATDHDICRLLFAGDKNPSAIDAHGDALGAWMLNPQMPAMTPASD